MNEYLPWEERVPYEMRFKSVRCKRPFQASHFSRFYPSHHHIKQTFTNKESMVKNAQHFTKWRPEKQSDTSRSTATVRLAGTYCACAPTIHSYGGPPPSQCRIQVSHSLSIALSNALDCYVLFFYIPLYIRCVVAFLIARCKY